MTVTDARVLLFTVSVSTEVDNPANSYCTPIMTQDYQYSQQVLQMK